jgi:hypothetical protein
MMLGSFAPLAGQNSPTSKTEEFPIETRLTIPLFIGHERQGTYFTLPFTMPPDTEVFSLSYDYERRHESEISLEQAKFTTRQEINIIDLGLIAPDGSQVGVSGSDKTEIFVSETRATPGYRPWPLSPGPGWQIIVGAYKVAPAGVSVRYELSFTPKHRRLLKGDLHAHTVASDGVLTVEELARHALKHGLDFLAVTDHNLVAVQDSLPQLPGLTLIPGVEWTHYQGHANFLGVDRPYDEPFFTNTPQEMQARFVTAHQRGALITIGHPFEPGMGFLFDLQSVPFDCIEIWNGPMRESNLKTVGFWHGLLAAGKKVPICGGSDYHRDSPFQILGGPATCVYAMSPSPADILGALRRGHAYITFAPNGPLLEMAAGEAMMGDSVPFSKVKQLQITARGLLAGDVLQVVTSGERAVVFKAETDGNWEGTYSLAGPGFAYVMILRSFIPGLPLLPALISNPIYFDG